MLMIWGAMNRWGMVLFMLGVVSSSALDNSGSTRVLVLGGTQFMGRLLVERLLKENELGNANYDISIMNRGKSPNPFNNASRDVRHIYCDRVADRRDCILNLQKEKHGWDYIVDFTGFHPLQIEDLSRGLLRMDPLGDSYLAVDHYIYISTDSVYMSVAAPAHDGFVLESDTISPNKEYALKLQQKNDYQFNYGGFKRQCELKIIEDGLLPFTILRLPDVFGPYDNQGAWPEIQQLILSNKELIPAFIPEDFMRARPHASPEWQQKYARVNSRSYRFSIIYAPDVINGVMDIMMCEDKRSIGQVYNLASDEPVTLTGLLERISEVLTVKSLRLDMTTKTMIPTTDFGPLNTSKFKNHFPDWRATPMVVWAGELVDWYKDPQHMSYHRILRAMSTTNGDADENGVVLESPEEKYPDRNKRVKKRKGRNNTDIRDDSNGHRKKVKRDKKRRKMSSGTKRRRNHQDP